MRMLLKIDEELLREAKNLLGTKNTSRVIQEALIDRISSEAQKRLAELAGYDPDFGKIKPDPESER